MEIYRPLERCYLWHLHTYRFDTLYDFHHLQLPQIQIRGPAPYCTTELTPESLCGFDENHTHAIIKDVDNTIYAKISPQTKRRVDDFFSKF